MPKSSIINLQIITLLLFTGLLLPIQSGLSYASDSTGLTQTIPKSATIERDSTSDGPHVFRQNDSTMIVFYLCNDSIIRQTFAVDDTLRFFGLCRDTETEYTITADPPKIEPCRYDGVSRIMALSDIHGEYEHLVAILIKGGVVDSNLIWIWGAGHLIIVGDIFDRGDKVTECLWLLYRLEKEARRFGGRVHFLLGNHELMVLRGDDRYINSKYLDGVVRKSRIDHRDLFGPDMELGRWLRVRHTAIKINDILFVHGGISTFLIEKEYSPESLNEIVRGNIDLRSSQLAFNDEIRFLFGSKGPFWYRGYHYDMEGRYPRATAADIDNILDFYDSQYIVVGHTEVDQVSTLYDGRIIAIDVPVEELGGLQALLYENGKLYKFSFQGELIPID